MQEPEIKLKPVERYLREKSLRGTLENQIEMPIQPELSDRIKDDKEIRDKFSKWRSIYFDPYKYYFSKDKIDTLEDILPNIESRRKTTQEYVKGYLSDKKPEPKKLSSRLTEQEKKEIFEKGDKKRHDYLKQVYEAKELRKQDEDVPLPNSPHITEYTHKKTTDVSK